MIDFLRISKKASPLSGPKQGRPGLLAHLKDKFLFAPLDVEQDGDGHDVRRQRADTVAHERERDARDRHDAHRHADVDEHVESQHRGDARGQQAAERVARIARRHDTAPEHDEV